MTEPSYEELTLFSPSRLGTAAKCGLAFEYQYVHRIPAAYETGAQLLGNAIHNGVEMWYGPDDDPSDHTERSLVECVVAQWPDLLPPAIWEGVEGLAQLAQECDAVAAAIAFKRPKLKSPEQTVEYQNSQAAKEFTEARLKMLEFCDKLAEVKWPKDEDPYKAYLKSIAMAKAMEARWKPLPRPIVVERHFQIQFQGFEVRGRIDQVRVDPHHRTGEVVPTVCDMKTGRNPLTQMEAFLQSFLYSEAARLDPDLPDVTDISFYLARFDKYQVGKIDLGKHRALASRILNGRAREIREGLFEPRYGFWCKQCDFRELCESEIALWAGDGLTTLEHDA